MTKINITFSILNNEPVYLILPANKLSFFEIYNTYVCLDLFTKLSFLN